MKHLVYDVGMCDGEDTAFYLHCGYRVVAIEARPDAVERAYQRFAEHVSCGDLKILNVGIANAAETSTFWVCESNPEWSSFNREIASRNDSPHHAISVPCVPFSKILQEHGRAYFLKVDIEGNDQLCLDALTPGNAPEHISFEMGHLAGIISIASLYRLGYRRFRCVRQNDFRALEPKDVRKLFLAARSPVPEAISRRLFSKPKAADLNERDYFHRPGSSGPFGDHLQGRWLNLTEISMIWSYLSDINSRWPSLRFWYDIHATLQ